MTVVLGLNVHDRPGVHLRPKARMLKAEATDTMLFVCGAWSPNNEHYHRT